MRQLKFQTKKCVPAPQESYASNEQELKSGAQTLLEPSLSMASNSGLSANDKRAMPPLKTCYKAIQQKEKKINEGSLNAEHVTFPQLWHMEGFK